MGREGSPTSVARDDMETATPSKENDVNPLHIHVGEEDDVRLYWRKRQIRQKYCSLLCMLLFGFFIGFGTGAGIFIQKDWGEDDDDDDDARPPDTIVVADFAASTGWLPVLDSVIPGGTSEATFVIEDGVARFVGSVRVVDVPSLNASFPGFVMAEKTAPFPDVSTCSGFVISCRHWAEEDYAGYRLGFGAQRAPEDLNPGRWASGFKAPFAPGRALGDVEVPFTSFSDDWDQATGEILVSCADDERVCPHASHLRDLQKLSVWAEGVEGDVHLEIHAIKAINCAGGAHTSGGSWSHAAATASSDESEDGGEPDDD